ncbi:hypothetical protein [Amycolatopsis sp. FDAARGOS 1241]|uniref:hypothetical protein n=1 Tax=Amycolatopsis sp. FDAARGOS 1241 TaxID=2778070 RepID=UPI00194EBAD7|nr:hypothetical protein [Amycolatopsis sp. FDAARGOS 1241]QRP48714.1 hypothetical protein I6J71_13365 [Amycolatopsis sp. FDAARGOS 1241]
MTEPPGDGDGTVELQIHDVRETGSGQVTVTVRCLREPVRLNTGSTRLSGCAQALDLKLTKVVVYGCALPELGTAITAPVTLRAKGVQRLRPSTQDTGYRVVQDTNAVP